uniref:Glycosyl hydrolase family 32 N-terminal domain-containing protein n=1 Tax=candidate division WOR-3 bacterium TaxID=2052148 RepID=A0A7C4CD40_UNCW3
MNRAILAVAVLGLSLATAQPLQNRILIARSLDGLDWQRTGIVFCDSADVPDAVRGPDQRFYVHYQGLWDPRRDGIMVAISTDGLSNWERHQVSIPGTETWPGKPCDPDVIMFGDTFRLYFTGDPTGDGSPETHSAVSRDGWNFVLEPGIRFEVQNRAVLDPSLIRTGDTFRYFAGGADPGVNWHALSTDGLVFTRQPDVVLDSLMLSNGLALDTGYRFYGFRNLLPCGIKSLFSADGGTWTPEPGWRLQIDSTSPLEYRYVKDAAVVRADSGFIMYYVTRKREAALEESREPRRHGMGQLPSFVRGVLRLRGDSREHAGCRAELLDISGRKVTDLVSGANDVSGLAPGVYFVRSGLSSGLKVLLGE